MKDCSQNLGPRLRHLSNRITQYMDQQFLALDLTSTQSFILHHLVLHEGEQIYPKDIEKRFHLTPMEYRNRYAGSHTPDSSGELSK